MMTAQDKERYDALVDTIDESLKILHKDYGSAFLLSICTTKDDDSALVHSGCDCTFEEALIMFNNFAEEDSNLAKAMGMVAARTGCKNN